MPRAAICALKNNAFCLKKQDFYNRRSLTCGGDSSKRSYRPEGQDGARLSGIIPSATASAIYVTVRCFMMLYRFYASTLLKIKKNIVVKRFFILLCRFYTDAEISCEVTI
jgi:hypothetical protein